MNNILITGGAGFIGSQLARRLFINNPDSNIYILDTFGKEIDNLKTHGTYKNLKDIEIFPLAGDIRNCFSVIKNNIKDKIDVIFHLAAISDTTTTDEYSTIDINYNSFNEILKLADNFSCPIIYASSGAVYGNKSNNDNYIGTESPNNIYGYTKLCMDRFSQKIGYKTFNGNKIIGLRFFNVYGNYEKNKGNAASMIYQLTNQLITVNKCKLFKNSDSIFRDFIFIDDIVEVLIKSKELEGGTYNVGTGKARTFLEVANNLSLLINNKLPKIEYIDNPYLDRYQFFTRAPMDDNNALYQLKINPHSLEDGLNKFYLEFKK